jgi:hypothetical protein
MFTTAEREALRAALISRAEADERIVAGALTGSGALDALDQWSDIDLTFGIGPVDGAADGPADGLAEVLADWTALMYAEHGAVHHLDVHAGATIYRVFLLDSTLQVDLSFAPHAEWGAAGPKFRLLFGTTGHREWRVPRRPAELAGLGWLYALHARSSLARGRPWQAEYMISGVRDYVLSLACLRHELPELQGRGMDDLPAEVTGPLAGALVRSLDPAEVARAFGAVTQALLAEIRHTDAALADRLAAPLRELAHLT